MKTVYTCFTTDVIHEGHLNIINKAKEYGDVIVGVLTDEAMVKFDRFPTISFEERMKLVESIGGISKVIKQDTVMYDVVVNELHPDYVIHGNNWCEGPTKAIRDNVEKLLSTYGGQIIDVPYTYNENVKHIDDQIKERLSISCQVRARRSVRRAMYMPNSCRICTMMIVSATHSQTI